LHPFYSIDRHILNGNPILIWKKGGRRMDIFEQVKKILCDQLDLDEEQVTEDSEVIDDLGADSLDIVDLVMTLEEEFDTEIPDEDIENLRTVGDIVKYIEERSAE